MAVGAELSTLQALHKTFEAKAQEAARHQDEGRLGSGERRVDGQVLGGLPHGVDGVPREPGQAAGGARRRRDGRQGRTTTTSPRRRARATASEHRRRAARPLRGRAVVVCSGTESRGGHAVRLILSVAVPGARGARRRRRRVRARRAGRATWPARSPAAAGSSSQQRRAARLRPPRRRRGRRGGAGRAVPLWWRGRELDPDAAARGVPAAARRTSSASARDPRDLWDEPFGVVRGARRLGARRGPGAPADAGPPRDRLRPPASRSGSTAHLTRAPSSSTSASTARGRSLPAPGVDRRALAPRPLRRRPLEGPIVVRSPERRRPPGAGAQGRAVLDACSREARARPRRHRGDRPRGRPAARAPRPARR